MLREVIRLLHVTQLYKVEAASELGALVSGSQALSPVPAISWGWAGPLTQDDFF